MDAYLEFVNGLYRISKLDLRMYKRAQMERRMDTFRQRAGFSTFKQLLEGLKRDRSLYNEFMDKVTINVSEFFRNPERWNDLTSILRGNHSTGTVKAWSAACSTGEEPYTLAMILDHLGLHHDILATDLDGKVLEAAKIGAYKEQQLRSVPESFKSTYFSNANGEFHVIPKIQKHITFQQHNLLEDSYPESLDLIVCRNVLIYFTDEAKEKILNHFATSLKPGGLLFVGSTEQFNNQQHHSLKLISSFIYQKTN